MITNLATTNHWIILLVDWSMIDELIPNHKIHNIGIHMYLLDTKYLFDTLELHCSLLPWVIRPMLLQYIIVFCDMGYRKLFGRGHNFMTHEKQSHFPLVTLNTAEVIFTAGNLKPEYLISLNKWNNDFVKTYLSSNALTVQCWASSHGIHLS